MKVRKYAALAAAGTMAATLAAGGLQAGASAEPVQLSILDNSIRDGKNSNNAVWIEDVLIPQFEAMMAEAGTPVEITFEGRGVADEDYKNQLSLDIGAGGGPDLFSMDGIWVGEFAEAGYIAPLSDTVGDAVDAWDGWDQINAAVQANGQYKGVRYGLPQGTDGRVIYTNKEIFEAAGLPADWSPATMDDVLDAARQIKANVPDVVPFQLNGGVSMGEATTMQGVLPLLAAAGAPVWDSETGLWTGNTPEMVRMLGTYATVYGDEELGNAEWQLLQDGRDQSFEQFAAGKVGMLIEGDYMWRGVINPATGNFPMEGRNEIVGWAHIPAYEPGGALGGLDGASMSGGGVWTVNPNSENAEMAWALLEFIYTPEQILSQLGEGNVRITARDDVNAELLTTDPLMSFISTDILPLTHFRPGFAEYPEVSRLLQEAVESVVTGTSPEDAAAAYAEALAEVVGADAVNNG